MYIIQNVSYMLELSNALDTILSQERQNAKDKTMINQQETKMIFIL